MNTRAAKTAARSWSPLSLRKNFSWTLAGNIVYAASQWGMLVVLAKLGNPEMVGQLALGLAVTAPIVLFFNLQLRSIQATDTKREFHFADYLGVRAMASVLALLSILGVALVLGYRWETALVIFIVGLSKVVEAIGDIYHGLFQQHERLDFKAQSLIIRAIASILAFSLTMYLTRELIWGVISLVGTWLAVLFLFDVLKGRWFLTSAGDGLGRVLPSQNIRSMFRREKLKQLVLLSLPLGVSAMLVSLTPNIPRYFVEYQLGEWELGIFAAIAYIMVAGRTVIGALSQSAMPRLARQFAGNKREDFTKLLTKLIALGIFVGIAGVLFAALFGRSFLAIVYQPEYAERNTLFVWIMVAAAISYVAYFLNSALTAIRLIRIQIPLFLLVVLTAVIASWVFIPLWGSNGAALALVAASAVQVFLSLVAIAYRLLGSRGLPAVSGNSTTLPAGESASEKGGL